MEQLVFLACILVLAAAGQGTTVVIVKEGDDAILPCSLREDITNKMFDWKKLGLEKKEVFMYDKGRTYGRNSETQDPQLNGRVSHFPDELKSGNASIIINDTKVADSGNYTCIFPHHQGGSIVSTVHLVVNRTLKDRTAENIPGASPRPYTMMGNATDDGVIIQCEVLGTYPEPTLHWQDNVGNFLPSDKPQVTENGGRYYVSLQTTVKQTETKRFVCVSTQEAISHTVKAEIFVPGRCEAPGLSVRDVIVFVLGCAVGAVGIGGIGGTVVYFKYFRKETRDQRTTNGHAVKMSDMSSEDPPDPSHQRLTRVVHQDWGGHVEKEQEVLGQP